MTNITLVDIDNTVLDNTLRETKARLHVNNHLLKLKPLLQEKTYDDAYKQLFYSEEGFYRPGWMREDQPYPGVRDYLALLEERGEHLFFYTSRMENQRAVTEDTLWSHELLTPSRDLLMKPMEFQYTPTLNYKVGLIPMIARLLKTSSIRLIDDEEKIREAALKAHPDIEVYASLADACA